MQVPRAHVGRDLADADLDVQKRRAWDAAIIAAGVAGGLGVIGIVWLFARAFAVFVLAITLASALAPLVRWLERRMPHTVAVVVLYASGFGALVLAGIFVAPALSDEIGQLGRQLPELIDKIGRTAGRVVPAGGAALANLAQNAIPRLVTASSQLASAGLDVVLIVFLSLYFLIEAPSAHRTAVGMAAPANRRHVSQVLTTIADEMGGYFRGAALNGIAVALLTWVSLVIVGLDFALPLAAAAFFGELLPYLGPILAAIPAVAIALTNSPAQALTVALVYVGIQQIEGHVLTPIIMHSQTHISAALVIVALTMGYTVGGILGAVTAIPLFAAGRVILSQIVAPALDQQGETNDARWAS